jgi:hypothetical protein
LAISPQQHLELRQHRGGLHSTVGLPCRLSGAECFLVPSLGFLGATQGHGGAQGQSGKDTGLLPVGPLSHFQRLLEPATLPEKLAFQGQKLRVRVIGVEKLGQQRFVWQLEGELQGITSAKPAW